MSEDINKELLSSVVSTVRAASSLAAQDVDFYRNLDKEISTSLNESSKEITNMINTLLLSINENNEELESGKEGLEQYWKDFSNVMDNLFEKSDRSLDIITRSKTSNDNKSEFQYLSDSAQSDSNPSKRVTKPQLQFSRPVDNSESKPFMPLLNDKPHSIKSFTDSLIIIPESEELPSHYAHPYEVEIDKQEYNASVLQVAEPLKSQPWNSESTWVDTSEALQSMLDKLKECTEIAVDLEHHDYRSYYGIVCLMQISTRKEDFLVDTLALRDELHILNEVFADPNILKVLHGAFMDIIWLQRDLGLYVVSLFDTYHASRALGFPRHSLAYLLEKYANFKTSKKYQLADWRVRPLSKPMHAYARADTHFLLNIYDQIRNQLIRENKLAEVLFESRNVAKRRFEYSRFRPKVPSPAVFTPIEKEEPWRTLVYQYNVPSTKIELLKRIWEWRDMIARRDDESPRYIMPNQLMISLVEYTPIDPAGVISVSNVMTDHVRSNSKVIANLIKKSLEDMKSVPAGALTAFQNIDYKIGQKFASDKLTISQIQNMTALFKEIASNPSIIEKDVSKKIDPILFSNIFLSKNEIVLYDHDKRHVVTNEQLAGRAEEVEGFMNEANNTTLAINIESSAEMHVEEPEAKEKNALFSPPISNVENASSSNTDGFEDMNDIIVLKDVKKRTNIKDHKKKQGMPNKEVIDYSKLDTILSKEKRENSKKRKGDPFGEENGLEGPKAAKKRKQINRGKNVSFKR
ncbi:hypothetical protein Kpol_1037p29 [Vanderwaltozyma polyspora DSM 70294]|uniref:HRDC domain-containing protein n=1 Tax=Vanderwaltozyma polyspora (strain ATCC 22028 / DSM 70294 / BCRC 21397 / CBS 2163 / NBRC 10782 / NRRL Y-8283 / UCD 57-17) TaxID=436907 RepID=A7TJX1_VANPO|nr:uncharacterized protein Kpol_1037p29 [Vanderwaltozyma polyspora DSM 70294]EDO17433.1 hypothetical protein Kpol_1037p29 [Vanderwaltozyma polyspora DSM 70294]